MNMNIEENSKIKLDFENMITSQQTETEYLKNINKEQLKEKDHIENEFDNWKNNINKELELTKTENSHFRKEHKNLIDISLEKNKELESIISLKESALKESNKINSSILHELEEFKRAYTNDMDINTCKMADLNKVIEEIHYKYNLKCEEYNIYKKEIEQLTEKFNSIVGIKDEKILDLERKLVNIDMDFFKEKQVLEQKLTIYNNNEINK